MRGWVVHVVAMAIGKREVTGGQTTLPPLSYSRREFEKDRKCSWIVHLFWTQPTVSKKPKGKSVFSVVEVQTRQSVTSSFQQPGSSDLCFVYKSCENNWHGAWLPKGNKRKTGTTTSRHQLRSCSFLPNDSAHCTESFIEVQAHRAQGAEECSFSINLLLAPPSR
eukprot:g15217.t1